MKKRMMKDVIPENDYIAIKFIFSGRYDDEPSGEGFVFVNPKYGEQKAIELAKQWASKQKMPSIIFKKIPNDVAKQRLAQYKYPIKGIIDSIKDSVKTYRINKRYFVDAKNVKDAYKIYKKEIKTRDDEDYYQNYKKRIVTENNYHKNDNSIEHTKKMILSDYKNGKLTKEEFDKLMRNIDKADFFNWN